MKRIWSPNFVSGSESRFWGQDDCRRFSKKAEMATSHFNRGSLIIKDENSGVNNLQKKDGINVKGKNVLGGLGSRRALNDITNKSVTHLEGATKRNNVVTKEEFNVKDEMFLHDHKKCEEARVNIGMSSFLEIVLPGIDLNHVDKPTRLQDMENIPESPRRYPEPMKEESETELSGSSSSTFSHGWDSASDSDSPPLLPWLLESVEFALKPETEA